MKEMIEVIEGESLIFEAEVTGYPEPTVQWTKTDVEITTETPGYEIQQDGCVHRLIISHAKPAMAALYNAKAQNDAGQTSNRGRLKVKGTFYFYYARPTTKVLGNASIGS